MKYQRVTEILYPFTGMKYIDPTVLENAATRGTKVHKICQGICEGLGTWDVPEEYKGYIDSFNSWFDTGRKIKAIEQRYSCDELEITGQVDLVVEEPDGLYVIDLKTSMQESKSWMLQGSAYSYLAKKSGLDIAGIMFIRLRRDGSDAKYHYYKENMSLFTECLNVYRYFYGRKPRKKT